MLRNMTDVHDASLLLDRPGAGDGEPAVSAACGRLDTLATPVLVLDAARMDANIERMRLKLAPQDVLLRPHLKTAKSIEIARQMMETSQGPATVSTLKEAEQFAAAGVSDMIYAVGIATEKLDRAVALRRRGIDLALLLDSEAQARSVAAKVHESGSHRGGLEFHDPAILVIARILHQGGVPLRGVLTHAGESYNCAGLDDLAVAAEQERLAAVGTAEMIRAAGLPCIGVSVGSTPTALFGRNFEGITEVRAGVFVFFDLVMAGLGVCRPEDVAVSVLASVIGRRNDGKAIIDVGWMALSRDPGRSARTGSPTFGAVCDVEGRLLPGLAVVGVNQEHGIVGPLDAGVDCRLQIGSRVRILPNHACATAAQHERYYVVRDSSPNIEAVWPRFGGW
jgi:D-serine deaminase-like pyridoxal phosphate-dependent protein